MVPLQSQLLHEASVVDLLGADCSPELHCNHNSHGCVILSNILPMLRISCSSIRHLPDLSGIVEDLPFFSEVRSFSSWYTLSLFLLFRQVISHTEYLLNPVFLSFQTPLVCFSVFFCSFCFIPLLLHIPQGSRISLVTHSSFLRRSFSSI